MQPTALAKPLMLMLMLMMLDANTCWSSRHLPAKSSPASGTHVRGQQNPLHANTYDGVVNIGGPALDILKLL